MKVEPHDVRTLATETNDSETQRCFNLRAKFTPRLRIIRPEQQELRATDSP